MVTCYIGIGSNLGDRQRCIDDAIRELKGNKDIKVTRVSTIYETEPVSDIPQGKFLNGVIELKTGMDARQLLKELNRIEEKLGRARSVKNAPRTIDLDILYYGDERINEADLVIPHPKIMERDFVIRGLLELGKI